MTNQEILTKAIEKAIASGLDWKMVVLEETPGIAVIPQHKGVNVKGDYYRFLSENNPFAPAFIFNHDFAKAIAGDRWQYLLKDMVIREEPLKILEKWL